MSKEKILFFRISVSLLMSSWNRNQVLLISLALSTSVLIVRFLQVFKVIKVFLTKIEKASEDPDSTMNQAGE